MSTPLRQFLERTWSSMVSKSDDFSEETRAPVSCESSPNINRVALQIMAATARISNDSRLAHAVAEARAVNLFNDDLPSGPISALHMAVADDKVDYLRVLLEYGGDPNCTNGIGTSVLYYAVTKKTSNQDLILKLLLSHGADMYNSGVDQSKSPFEILVCEGRLSAVRLFLENGFDLARYDPGTSEDFSPLHQAILLENGLEMLGLLLKYNGQGSLNLEHKDKEGFSPLCLALRNKSLHCIRLLLRAGANPNRVHSEGHAPLYFILARNQSEYEHRCIQLLVEAGAQIDEAIRELIPDILGASGEPDENEARDHLELAKRLVKYRVVHESRTSVTNPINQGLIARNTELQNYCRSCEAEIALLKSSLILKTITYHHVFVADQKLYKGATKDLVFKAFDENDVKSRFPLYAEDLCKRFQNLKDTQEI